MIGDVWLDSSGWARFSSPGQRWWAIRKASTGGYEVRRRRRREEEGEEMMGGGRIDGDNREIGSYVGRRRHGGGVGRRSGRHHMVRVAPFRGHSNCWPYTGENDFCRRMFLKKKERWGRITQNELKVLLLRVRSLP
jgi:hypothetical protein